MHNIMEFVLSLKGYTTEIGYRINDVLIQRFQSFPYAVDACKDCQAGQYRNPRTL